MALDMEIASRIMASYAMVASETTLCKALVVDLNIIHRIPNPRTLFRGLSVFYLLELSRIFLKVRSEEGQI